MEIRNNTPIYYNNAKQSRSQTSFGMAMLKPQNVEAFAKNTGMARKGLMGRVHKRGVRQLVDNLKGVANYHVQHEVLEDGQSVYHVVAAADGSKIKTYSKDSKDLIETAMDRVNAAMDAPASKYGFVTVAKRLGNFARGIGHIIRISILKPKEALPKALLTAAEESKKLNKEFIKAEKARAAEELAKAKAAKKAQQRLESAVKELDDIFEN